MNSATIRSFLANTCLLMALIVSATAQQTSEPVHADAGQISQPAGVGGASGMGAGRPAPGTTAAPNATANAAVAEPNNPGATPTTKTTSASAAATNADDNPYDPLLEPPPLPKGKPTLIGGRATSVDHVRNRITVKPFGGGTKIKLFVDERSHIYRNGAETTVLGIQKGDRIYVDTMLDGSKVFAKNIRVVSEMGLAEVRGQVMSVNAEKGTLTVQDQLSARPVTFAVAGNTKYNSIKGAAVAGDVRQGSLVDVQFSPRSDNRVVAQEILVLAKPGDDYIFSGVVTSVDMRSNTLALENHSDDQTYEIRFNRAALSDPRALKVGSEITAHTVFDGKQYKASNVRVEDAKKDQSVQSEVQ